MGCKKPSLFPNEKEFSVELSYLDAHEKILGPLESSIKRIVYLNSLFDILRQIISIESNFLSLTCRTKRFQDVITTGVGQRLRYFW